MQFAIPENWRSKAQDLIESTNLSPNEWLSRFSDLSKAIIEWEAYLSSQYFIDVQNISAKNNLDEFYCNEWSDWVQFVSKLEKHAIYLYKDTKSFEIDILMQKFIAQQQNPTNITSKLNAKIQQKASKFAEIQESAKFIINGEEVDIPTINTNLKSEEEDVRKRAYLTIWERVEGYSQESAKLFIELLQLRKQLANESGFDNFLDYQWCCLARTNYTRADIEQFRKVVRQQVAPRLAKLRNKHAERLDIEPGTVRPWDTGYFPGIPKLIPKSSSETEFENKIGRILEQIDSSFSEIYFQLNRDGWLDMHPRAGKALFPFMETFAVQHKPWVSVPGHLSNWRISDLMHELGHAIHRMSFTQEEWIWNILPPMEFQEFVAQGFEALSLPYWGEFFTPEQKSVLEYAFWERSLITVISTTAIDEFQEWAYLQNPNCLSPSDLFSKYESIISRYPSGLDWTGLEKIRSFDWIRMNVFDRPLYMIEYALSWIGVYQLWTAYQIEPQTTIDSFKKSLSVGGYRVKLESLFQIAGVTMNLTTLECEQALAFLD